MNRLGTHLCFCRDGFAGELCEMPTDDNDRCTCDNDNDGNSDTNNRTCSSFSVIRRDDGDRVNTPLSSVEYCRSIRAYCPDGSCSYCQCEFRLTYRHDLQRCDDYYNGQLVICIPELRVKNHTIYICLNLFIQRPIFEYL